MQRRYLLAALAAGRAAGPNLALADAPQRIPLSKAFQPRLLSRSAARPAQPIPSVFTSPQATSGPDLRLAIIGQGPPQPVLLDALAQVTRLPTLAQLKSDADLQVSGGPFRFATEIRPDIEPATRLDVGQLDASLTQATAAVAHMAGAFSAMAPKFNTVVFPDAGSGQAIFADGRAAPLPITHAFKTLGPTPYLPTDAMPGARTVMLARTPSRLLLGADAEELRRGPLPPQRCSSSAFKMVISQLA